MTTMATALFGFQASLMEWMPSTSPSTTISKKQDPKVVWDYRRKEVAKVIKYAQNNPSTECRTVINDSATAVALVCKKPGGATTSFPNMVASQFDKYLDDVMITPMEDAGVSVATGGGGVMGPGQQQHFSETLLVEANKPTVAEGQRLLVGQMVDLLEVAFKAQALLAVATMAARPTAITSQAKLHLTLNKWNATLTRFFQMAKRSLFS
jgi:hypothetical protein